ncbi:hypothetical protein HD806DRAFT_529597 [Xylariaceae sp. AK1471]|nr:hypothetical protein HD806DRAFT_529597 [Xylariaceae sp. AK1471]
MKLLVCFFLVAQIVKRAAAGSECWFDPVGITLPLPNNNSHPGPGCYVSSSNIALDQTNPCLDSEITTIPGDANVSLSWDKVNSCIQHLDKDLLAYFPLGISVRNWNKNVYHTLITSSAVETGKKDIVNCNIQFNISRQVENKAAIIGPNLHLLLHNLVENITAPPDSASIKGLTWTLCPTFEDISQQFYETAVGFQINVW